MCWASDTNLFLVVFTGRTDILGSDEQEIFGELVEAVPAGIQVAARQVAVSIGRSTGAPRVEAIPA